MLSDAVVDVEPVLQRNEPFEDLVGFLPEFSDLFHASPRVLSDDPGAEYPALGSLIVLSGASTLLAATAVLAGPRPLDDALT